MGAKAAMHMFQLAEIYADAGPDPDPNSIPDSPPPLGNECLESSPAPNVTPQATPNASPIVSPDNSPRGIPTAQPFNMWQQVRLGPQHVITACDSQQEEIFAAIWSAFHLGSFRAQLHLSVHCPIEQVWKCRPDGCTESASRVLVWP